MYKELILKYDFMWNLNNRIAGVKAFAKDEPVICIGIISLLLGLFLISL